MADCCAQLRIELVALKQEVSKLQSINEQSIIDKAVAKAEARLNPGITQAFTTANTAATVAGVAYKLGEGAQSLGYKALSSSRSAAVVADIAKKQAVNAASIGELASMRAGQAFAVGNKAAAEAAIAKALGTSAQGAAATASATATKAGVLASVAQAAAAASSAFAASAFGKAVIALANVTSLVGAVAGLFSLYATLKIVFPRLDAHDRQLDLQGELITRNSAQIFRQGELIRGVQYEVNVANGKADKLARDLLPVKLTAQKADYISNIANTKADNIAGQLPGLTNLAQAANYKADLANGKADNLAAQLPSVQVLAERANYIANQAQGTATQVAIQLPPLEILAERAGEIAKDAQGTAGKARSAADLAVEQVSQVRPISESALTNAFQALNKVNVVEPIATNAFTATQFQSTQLKSTQLEVTKLGEGAKVTDRKIVDLGKKIDNYKPPTTSNPEVDKEALEKLTQVIVSVGALKIAMDNMPRNIANSPAFQGAVTTAATTANCRTAQPGGCTTRMVNDVVNNANNGLLNKLGGAFNTGANVAQLALLNNIQSGVTAANTKLGPLLSGANGISGFLTRLSGSLGIDRALNLIAIASNLHNAMMLSANLKVTLLEMLSSVGNATGLLQTSENENVDLNAVFNKGIETFLISILGVESYAGLKVGLRKYNAIYQAATNSLNAVSSMFNSLGNVVEQGAEYTGKIGNALKGAGMVAENSYQWMAEKFDAKTSKFIKFQSTVGDVTQVLETINEIAESVVEGQQAATEFQKANADFVKAVADAKKNPGIENKAIKEEAAKAKENATKDPTGEIEEGLLSFLTN